MPKGGIWPLGFRTNSRKAGSVREVEAIRGTPVFCPDPETPSPSEPWHLLQPIFSKTSFPFCGLPVEAPLDCFCPRLIRASEVRTTTSAARITTKKKITASLKIFDGLLFSLIPGPSAWLRVNVNQRGLSAFDNLERPVKRRRKILGVRDGALRVQAQALCELRIINAGVINRGANLGAIDSAAVAIGHDLHLHDLLMIGAIVVHDRQERNAMMRGGPQNSGSVHQVAVALDIHGQPAVLAVRQGRADRGRRAVADPVTTGAANELVILVNVPQL